LYRVGKVLFPMSSDNRNLSANAWTWEAFFSSPPTQ
jgi:hypothetical protein